MAKKSQKKLRQDENPELTQVEYLQPISNELEDDRYPWQSGIADNMLPGLNFIRTQISSNMPLELVLRLDFLLKKRNVGFSRKVSRGDLINEAIEQYTRLRLIEMGCKIDKQSE